MNFNSSKKAMGIVLIGGICPEWVSQHSPHYAGYGDGPQEIVILILRQVADVYIERGTGIKNTRARADGPMNLLPLLVRHRR